MTPKILIIGANGQIGTELAVALAAQHGDAAVITSDISPQGRVPSLRHEMLAKSAEAGRRGLWKNGFVDQKADWRAEDVKLNKMGVRSRQPKKAMPDDPWARYRLLGLTPEDFVVPSLVGN